MTNMSSESVCQAAHSWVDVGSFHTRLFEFVCVTCSDFRGGSERKKRVSITFCANLEKSATETITKILHVKLREPNLELYTAVSIACPDQNRLQLS
jgi:hypothetical protein